MKKWILAVIVAVIISAIVRVTIFTDDCNLVVMGITFLAALAAAYAVIRIAGRICSGCRKSA